jgi:phenylpropionate dioxygenase-like ring-hydroxylating dioxygenase large terminal subunit
LLGKNYVLWKDSDNKIRGVLDRCSHRGAKLSQGIVKNKCIECPYHGWQFDGKGTCTKIPQMSKKSQHTIPKATTVAPLYVHIDDGIVWASNADQPFAFSNKWHDNDRYFVTDTELDANYDFMLQIENLLDPAHIHFVHDGFQGKSANASHISVENMVSNDQEISALFVHENNKVPNIHIKYHVPSVVEVSVYNGKHVVRKNIIYVTPTTSGRCKVFFRDVCIKQFITPSNPPILKDHLDFLINKAGKTFFDQHYQLINTSVVKEILQQDVDVLEGQTQNMVDYFDDKYILPTESDRLIVEFRKWAKSHQESIFH